MLKKIALGALLTGLVAVLIWGAVIRTSAKSGGGAEETERRGRATEYAAAGAVEQSFGGRGSAATEGAGRGGRWAQGSASKRPQPGRAASRRRTCNLRRGASSRAPSVSVADDLVEIQSAAGEVIPFEGQPLRFALSRGLALKVGDPVTLSGFDEDGEFKIGQVTDPVSGVSIVLRDADGRPGWSGRGQRG